MTDERILFTDRIVAKTNENGKLVVMKGKRVLSPYEYDWVKELTPRCYALFRCEALRYDLIFPNGKVEFGYKSVYVLEKVGGKRRKRALIGAMFRSGTDIMDDLGNFLAIIPDSHYIVMVDDRFFVALYWEFSDPYVRVYNLDGHFLADGCMNEALKRARQKEETTL